MLTKTLTTTLVTGLLLTGAMQSQSFANNGGGGDGAGFDWATMHNKDGSTVTSRGNRKGKHTVTKTTNRGGCIFICPFWGGNPPAPPVQPGNRVNRPWASSYDPATRTRVTSVGNGDRTRTVITISPFGLSIGLSR